MRYPLILMGIAKMADLNTYIVVGGLIFNLVSTAIIGTWKLSRVELSLRETISKAEKETDALIERRVNQFGDTIAALRQKINDVELNSEKTFMRRDSFIKVQDTIENSMRSFVDRIEGRLERMENKIDTKT